MSAPPFSVCIRDWDAARGDASRIRVQVFVQEQGVPAELEMDAQDAQCIHALAHTPGGAAVGTGRLLPDGHIGRMAVLKNFRGKGVGALLLESLVVQARLRGHAQVRLNAQIAASGFYLRYGFKACGAEFMEAGIPHVEMVRELRNGAG